jgi:hypothetical protein
MPPVASELCQILPPPASFNGPFVIVDKLMDVFNKTEFPEEFPGIHLSKNISRFMSIETIIFFCKKILASFELLYVFFQ